MPTINCASCSAPFHARPSQIARGFKCCSVACRRAYAVERRKREFPQRFWAKVKCGGEGECWPWSRAVDAKGYGMVGAKGFLKAHRAAYELAKGPVPRGRYVCHTCDTPSCCNPAHLWLGSAAENSRDMVRKGRSQRGESHSQAKLTAADVLNIRARYRRKTRWGPGLSQDELAREYGVSRSAIQSIIEGRGWLHLITPRSGQET